MLRAAYLMNISSLVLLVSAGLLYAQDPAWWRIPDSSVRMAQPDANSKTRSAAQAGIPEKPFQSVPATSGITAEEVLLFCALITAIAAALTRFVINPALDKRDAAIREQMRNEYVRLSNKPEDGISRRENDLLEEMAKLEHQRLSERINDLNAAIKLQGQRFDYEFSKSWRATKRVLKRVHKLDKNGFELESADESED